MESSSKCQTAPSGQSFSEKDVQLTVNRLGLVGSLTLQVRSARMLPGRQNLTGLGVTYGGQPQVESSTRRDGDSGSADRVSFPPSVWGNLWLSPTREVGINACQSRRSASESSSALPDDLGLLHKALGIEIQQDFEMLPVSYWRGLKREGSDHRVEIRLAVQPSRAGFESGWEIERNPKIPLIPFA